LSSVKSIFEATQSWAAQRDLAMSAYHEIGSTNDEAKLGASDLGDEPKLYLAGHQTKGRGRGTNSWLDTGAGESLLSSWSFHLPSAPQAITGPRIGDALYRSAEAVWPTFDLSLKAPNDLYLGNRKIAGLLIETVSQGSFHRLIIGLGMNMLNHPRAIAHATHFISQSVDHGLGEDEWYQFLDVLLGQFKIALHDVMLPALSTEVRTSLLKALNAWPLKQESFINLSPQGDLVTKSGTIPWTSQ
jgi:BirA family biotin operon repressor/biotin-[acetyl-CoA-carboxylase] ligase